MTDKELLEAAAKAAGISFNWVKDWAGNEGVGIDGDGRTATLWNPLTSDADSFRLAVKLSMNISIGRQFAFANNSTERFDTQDPYAATRRAIVRAAAEIGKTK